MWQKPMFGINLSIITDRIHIGLGARVEKANGARIQI
jgi:hypothetical protein